MPKLYNNIYICVRHRLVCATVIYIPDMYDPYCSHCRPSLVISVIHPKSHDDTRACFYAAMQQSVLRLWLLMCALFISIMNPTGTVSKKRSPYSKKQASSLMGTVK